MRSEIGKLMRLARIAMPDAIYDAPAAAQNFANFKPEITMGKLLFVENENSDDGAPKPIDFEHMSGFKDFVENKPEVRTR